MGAGRVVGLLLQVVLLTVPGAQANCGVNEYPHQGLCCLLCEAGTFVAEHCRASHWNGKCDLCKEGKEFTPCANGQERCLPCRQCNEDQITLRPCNRTHDAECQCKPGYSCADDHCEKCERNSPMHPDGKEILQNSTDATDRGVPSQGMSVVLAILVLLVLALLIVIVVVLKKLKCDKAASTDQDAEGGLVQDPLLIHEEANNNETGEKVKVAGNEEGKHDGDEEDDGHNVKWNFGSLLEERLQLPALDLDKGCSIITDLMDKLTDIFGQSWSNSFYPVPQQAIGVGSAFEGWSPRAEDLVYHVLVPLSPPPGHAFHLELDTAGVLQRNGCVHVELLCTCKREQLGEDMLCFLHSSEMELRRDQDLSLLDTLCTDCCLDVEKTVHWFYQFMKEAWVLSPQSRHWRLRLLPSSRSCKFQLRNDQESLMVEVILGVRQGDSDIFLGSQPAEVAMPSITWLETYAVAEAKFFRHISRQAPHDSWHCKCLQLLSRILTGGDFSSYALKTVLMHLLNTIPLTLWGRKDFRWRILNIVMYLRCSLDAKQLNHFVLGNERFPMDISLPSDLRVAESPNLFQHLASSPGAHKKAMQEYGHLLHQLEQMLF